MFVTSLRVPTLEEVKEFNKNTRDGDGTLVEPENKGKVTDIFDMEDPIFQFNTMGYNYEDPLVLGLAWAYLIANYHIFRDGNKSTATQVLKFIVENNGGFFKCNDEKLIDEVNKMVPDTGEEIDPGAIGKAVEELKDLHGHLGCAVLDTQ